MTETDKEYWARFDQELGAIDWEKDSMGLRSACIPGAPLWLNEYHNFIQAMVLGKLMPAWEGLPLLLDIGCGEGRWCKIFAYLGYRVMGIDIRAGAIARCRERLPSVNFQVSSIEEFSGGPYDVVTSVTVLQHIRDQRKAAESIFKLLKPGGSMVMLENIKFRSETCFGNSIQKWVEIMEGSGFEVERILAYDYSPWLKLRFPSFILKWLMPWGLRVEEFLITQQPQYLKSQHCGFLFRKPI